MKTKNLVFAILGIAMVFLLLFLSGCGQKESSDVTEQELQDSMGSLDDFSQELDSLNLDVGTSELEGVEELAG